MKHLLIIILQITALNIYAQQKAMFSQYMFNPALINPAYSTVDESLNITAVARQQWAGFKGAPNTQTISLHSPLGKSNTFIGVIAFRDQIGEAITETGGYFTLAQRLKVSNKTFLSVGFNAGPSQYTANYSNIGSSVDVLDDPSFTDQNDLRFNVGAGIMLFSDKFYTGLSSPFLYTFDHSQKHTPHIMLQSGYIFTLGNDLLAKPNILAKYVSGSPVQVDFNLNFLLKETFGLGVSYRSMDSVDLLAKLFFSKKLSLGYAYDYNTSKLARTNNGSHEVMLNMRFPVSGRGLGACFF